MTENNTGFPRIKYGAGSVKPGMTLKNNVYKIEPLAKVYYPLTLALSH
jgi:hypothetical protein